ncbi:hypothetical protein GCM10009430_07330 [Aquimarina litoralis]|uniref:Uncharacterized protein n=1 Tax=Aquimarina litoralis TaxID=584605 RepID=A0ABN1IJE4_9FLAO
MKKFVNSENRLKTFFALLLPLFFSYDFIAKVFYKNEVTRLFYDYAVAFKICYIVVGLFLFRKLITYNTKTLYVAFVLGICYLVNQLLLYDFLDTKNILFNGYYFLSCFFSVLFIAFISSIKAEVLKKVIDFFLIFITLNSIAVLAGFIFEINIFKTYFRGDRFGYQGFLLYHSEAGYIYFLSLIGYAHKYGKEKKAKYFGNIILIFFTVFLIGTKKAIFSAVLFLIYFLIANKHLFKSRLFTFSFLVALAGIVVVLQNLWDKLLHKFILIYQHQNLVSALLSYREITLKEHAIPFMTEKWNFMNYIIGGPLFSSVRVELELFDIFLFFGILGVLCYGVILVKVLKNTNKRILHFSTFALLIATLFSGNLVSSMNVMLLYSMMYVFINSNDKNFRDISDES